MGKFRYLPVALAAALMAPVVISAPASAAIGPLVGDTCSYSFVIGGIACQGYLAGNYFTGAAGSSTSAAELAQIILLLNGTANTGDLLPSSNGPTYSPPYNGLSYGTVLASISGLAGGTSMNFGINLTGLTIVGAHFGNNIDSDVNNVSAFWLVDLGSTTTQTLTLANGAGSSNAQVFSTGGTHMPEPATWAMMLVGFGIIGFGMRRRSVKTKVSFG